MGLRAPQCCLFVGGAKPNQNPMAPHPKGYGPGLESPPTLRFNSSKQAEVHVGYLGLGLKSGSRSPGPLGHT